MMQASAACGLFDFSLANKPVGYTRRRFRFYKAIVESINFKQKICQCRGADVKDGHSFNVRYDNLVLGPGQGCVASRQQLG